MIFKLSWVMRSIYYRLFFKKIEWPGYIGKATYLHGVKKVSIGREVRIFPHCRIEVHGGNSSIKIEEKCSIGQGLHIVSGQEQELVISKNTTISANVFITNVEHQFHEINTHIMNQPLISKNTFIGENCFIGYGAVIQAGTILGKQCIIGSNAVVRGTFPDYSVIVGIPARVVKRYNQATKHWEKTDSKGDFLT